MKQLIGPGNQWNIIKAIQFSEAVDETDKF
jgi:hypothetical protein